MQLFSEIAGGMSGHFLQDKRGLLPLVDFRGHALKPLSVAIVPFM